MKKAIAILTASILGFTSVYAQETEAPQNVQEQTQTQAKKRGKKNVDPAKRQEKMAAKRVERMNKQAAEIRATYDTDKDGKLSADEQAAMEKTFEEAKKTAATARTYDFLKSADKDGDLNITVEELKERMEELKQQRGNRNHEHGRKGRMNRQK